jgi:hypothetical protein
MPQVNGRSARLRPSAASRPSYSRTPAKRDQTNGLFSVVGTSVEQAQTQLGQAVEEIRARMQEAADQAQERASAAADLALKLAYASVGAVVVAQEEISARVRRARN